MYRSERALTAVAVTNSSIHWLATGLIVPILAIFQIDRGLSLAQVGLNIAIYSGVIAVMELPTGGLSDTMGRRRVYLMSLGVKFAAAITLALSFSPFSIAVGFALDGLARALASGCMDAYFVDAFGDLEESGPLQRFLGRIGAAIPLALAVGGLVGGWIPDLPIAGALGGPFDRYSPVFFTVALVAVVQFFATMAIVPSRSSDHEARGLIEGFRRIPSVVRDAFLYGVSNRIVLLLLLGTAAWGITFAALEQLWQPFVDGITAQRSPTRLFGYLTGAYFLVGTLGSITANALFKRIGERYGAVMIALRVLSGLLFLVIAGAETVVVFALFYLMIFFLNGIANSPEQTLFNNAVPSRARATLLSFQSLFLQAGGGTAALVWGIFAENYSITLVWRIAGVIFALSALFYLRSMRDGRYHSTDKAGS